MSYICIHIHINKTHVNIHIHKHTCMHIHINTHTYLYTSVQPLLCVRICLFSHVLVDTCEYQHLFFFNAVKKFFFVNAQLRSMTASIYICLSRGKESQQSLLMWDSWRTHPITQHAHTGVFRVSDCLNTRTCFRTCLSSPCYTFTYKARLDSTLRPYEWTLKGIASRTKGLLAIP